MKWTIRLSSFTDHAPADYAELILAEEDKTWTLGGSAGVDFPDKGSWQSASLTNRTDLFHRSDGSSEFLGRLEQCYPPALEVVDGNDHDGDVLWDSQKYNPEISTGGWKLISKA